VDRRGTLDELSPLFLHTETAAKVGSMDVKAITWSNRSVRTVFRKASQPSPADIAQHRHGYSSIIVRSRTYSYLFRRCEDCAELAEAKVRFFGD